MKGSSDADIKFIEKRTGLSLKTCTKQVFRRESDFFLEVKYLVTVPNEFIVQNQVKQRITCNEKNDVLGERDALMRKLICFNDKKNDWSASLNLDSSYCTIVVWYQDFSGD
jgi:hypothetical protein